MAIPIDRVYQKVLTFANKEQRGYITPQEFNLFAHQAQMEIFEQYFYDVNQWQRQHGNNLGYSDMLENLQEKISLFEHTAIGDNVTVLNRWGDISLTHDIPNLYRLGSVFVKYPENRGYVEAEVVDNMKEFRLLSESKLTSHSRKRPVYHRYKTSVDKIKIYPYPVEDDGSHFDLSNQEFAKNYIQVKSTLHPGDWNPADGVYFYFDQQEMIDLLGDEFSHGDIVKISTTDIDGNINKITNHEVMLFTVDSENAINGNAHGRLEPYSSTGGDFNVGDRIFLGEMPKPLSNKRNVKVDYVRTPITPNWNYVVVNEKPLYNSTTSTDFELHQSEESELVYRILAYTGIAIEKPNLTQVAAGLEQAKVQQEKQ